MMLVQLRLQSIYFSEDSTSELRTSTTLATLFQEVKKADLWPNFQYAGRAGSSSFREFNSLQALIDLSVGWKEGVYLITNKWKSQQEVYLEIQLSSSMIGLLLGFGGEWLDKRRDILLDQFVAFAFQLHAAFRGKAQFGPSFLVEPLSLVYPRHRPPHIHVAFGLGNLIDFFDLDFHMKHPLGRQDEVEKIMQASLPEGSIRNIHNGLAMIRWATDLNDEGVVQAQVSRQEQWMTEMLKPPIMPSFNELGDEAFISTRMEKHPPLTFYESMNQRGYKAIYTSPRGDVDEEEWEEITSWLQSNQLPDGSPLKELYLIVPDRQRALKLNTLAKSIGVAGIYYVGEDNKWWNPFPKGLWIPES
jgi:hypothetical protein